MERNPETLGKEGETREMKIKRKRRIGRRRNNTTRQLLRRADDIAFRF